MTGLLISHRCHARFGKELRTPRELGSVLARCNWLVIACPLTDETRGLVGAERLAQLPPDAHLINVARGEIVDEPALIAALAGARLAGAYLDAFAQEPLPAASPLWALPNVLITPHNSAASAGNEARINAIFLDNLKRWINDQNLVNEVTKP